MIKDQVCIYKKNTFILHLQSKPTCKYLKYKYISSVRLKGR